MIGEVVGSYRITQKLSVGGMGTVYRAEHVLIGRDAAIKVLHPELSSSHDIVQRFFNEAKATTSIKHPGIVEVFDFGYMPSGHAYLVMEFLEGMSLARRMKLVTERMSEGEAALMLRSVCNALAAAHAKGIVHRDLKPDNLFLVPDAEVATGERPKILDFGIAKLTDIGLAGTTTKTGAVMGTPTYMSPEQCRGTGVVDARADLYSLGCIYFELLCGRPPFTEVGAGELIGAHLFVEPPRPSQFYPTISPDSEALVMALLQKRPEQRPQTATDLARLFGNIAQRHGWVSATRPSLVNLADQPTVVGTPLEMARLTPPPPITPPPMAHLTSPAPAQKPTTLSGAASQSVVEGPQPRSRRGLFIGIAAVVLAAAAGIAIIGFTGPGNSNGSSPAPASAPNDEIGPTKTDTTKTDTTTKTDSTTKTDTSLKSDSTTKPDSTSNTDTTSKTDATSKTAATSKTDSMSKTDTTSKTDTSKTDTSKTDTSKTDTSKTHTSKTHTSKRDTTTTKKPTTIKKPKQEPEKKPTLIETDIE